MESAEVQEKKLYAYIDGASRGNPGHSALAVVVMDGENIVLEKAAYLGIATNNVAEYSALVQALSELRRLGATDIHIMSDSELLVRQINGQYKVKAEGLRSLYINAMRMLSDFPKSTVTHITRDKNKRADKLANKALDEAQLKKELSI
jgi:ribonuclease HI